MRVAQAGGGEIWTRLVGAVVAAVAVPVAFGVAEWLYRGAIDASTAFERPDVVLQVFSAAAVVGFCSAPSAARGRRLRVFVIGPLAGVAWLGVVILGLSLAASVSELLRGAMPDLVVPIAWLLYGFVIVLWFAAVPVAAAGAAWALLTRLAVWAVAQRGRPHRPLPFVRRAALATFLVTVAVAGGVDARLTLPAGARCISVPGERPVAAAWSPDGSLLAIASTKDPNEKGHVHVFRWPSQQLLASWETWVEETVAVDDTGRAYWSASVLGARPVDLNDGSTGILTAAPGGQPSWFTSDAGRGGAEVTLWSMSWTRNGLVGRQPNSGVVALVPFGGRPPVSLLRQGRRSVDAVWASPDGEWLATAVGANSVRINHDGDEADVTTPDPRYIAMTSDRRGVVVASWDGGTRLVDVATGKSQLVLRGNQTWIAVSSSDALAWANQEAYGAGVACVIDL